MALSSINFQKSSGHSYKHNFREDEPSYLLKEKDREPNEYWQHEKTAEQIFTDEVAKIEKGKKGKRPKFENSHWEGVLNLNSNHTMDEVKKVAEHIEKKFNITCTAIAIHRDEGHYTDNGYAVKNYHAHLNFCTYKDKKQQWRLENIKPQDLRELQTEIAEILKMERGIDKRESKRQRLEHREYKQKERELKAIKQELEVKDNVIQAKNQVIQDKDQELEDEKLSKKRIKEQIKQEAQEREHKIKEILCDRIDKIEADIKEKDKVIQDLNQELEQEKLSKAELKKELEQLRKDSKNKGFSKEFFQEINLEKKELRFDNKKELEVWFQKLVEQHTKKGILSNKVDNEAIFEDMYKVYQEPYKVIQSQNQEIQALKAENNEIKAQKHTLTQEQIQEIINQALAQKEAEIEKIKKEARERETQKNQEIQALKADKQRFNELLEQDPALNKAYNQALEALKNRENEEIKYYSQLNFITDDKPLFSTTDKTEVSEQNQENDHDDYEDKTQEDNKPKIRKHR